MTIRSGLFTRLCLLLLPCMGGTGLLPTRAASLAISEFLASNSKGITDENGDASDWIEIRNTTAQTVNAAGWLLTDDLDVPAKWSFPSTNIPPGGYLVVFASGKDRRTPGARLHTNFQLNDQGEYLALLAPDAETVATEFTPQFPPQVTDASFGLDATGAQRFFPTPTPGTANGAGFVDRVADTKFNVDRGFFDSPFDLTITCATEGAEIRYTTNGTVPTATSGLVYRGAIRIAGTTALRAAAFKPGHLPSNADTQSYLFVSDIILQSPTGAPPPGWPTSWGSNTRDYGMDPDVVNDPRYKDKIQGALKSLPSFCVTMDLADLFDRTRGIYANPGQDGRAWERPMSLELVFPNGQKGFQVDGGIRIRGGFSRSTSNPKHAFRFFFRSEYGPGKLRYPVFGEQAADEFDGFDLRTFQNYSWSFQGDGSGTFLRDVFNRDVQLAMGSQGERGDYYHLYINGQYWGLFNTCERPEASYAETYYGGNKDEYDVIKVEAGSYVTLATDGTMAGWTQVYNLVKPGVNDTLYRRLLGQNPDGSRNPDYPVYLDPVNLTDYMLIILWGGNLDAPISNFLGNTSPNNYFGIWNRVRKDMGFQWFVHDAEHTLLNLNQDRTGPWPAGDSSVTKSNPQWLWQKLLASQEFKMVVRDRIQRHFFNGGVLTPEGARAIYSRRKDQIDSAVIAESARWGDAKRPSDPFDRDSNWVPAVNANLNYIAARPNVALNQLRNDGLFPSIPVPQFNQHGGTINPGFGLLMAPTSATIYYTLDGSDPRRPGGSTSPSAIRYSGPIPLTESSSVKARILQNNDWSALNEAEFTVAQTFTELALTEIHYHPASTPDTDGDEFEFIELKNVGRQTLDLSGVQFTDGIGFRFPNGTRLASGQFAILVRNPIAFAARYPGVSIAGTYTGGLANSGERLTLTHAIGTPLLTVAFGTRPPWPAQADGQGFSLVPVQANASPSVDSPTAWRASARPGGSPGADDTSPGIVPVVVNEILAHTDPPLIDAVEIHNPSDTPAPIGGWWLSDDRQKPAKFRIPTGVTIPPGGFVTFSEQDFNRPTNAPSSFNFSSYGEEAWIFSADTAGNLTGFSDGFSFPASPNATTLGRYTNSVGRIHYPTLSANTLGAPNAAPLVGPVVFNEIHYSPLGGQAEFVELRNLATTNVALFDPAVPAHTWRIAGLGFAFPPNITLPPNGLAVVTSGDPAAFRSRYGVPSETPVFGPCDGTLQDNGETITLERPDKTDLLPDGSIFVPYLVAEQVDYNNVAPWPVAAAGLGSSLERKTPVTYGNDPNAWRASFAEPSPGLPNDGNRPPIARAGSDQEFEASRFPLEITLAGTGSDDGLPLVPGQLSFLWSQLEGPGVVSFDDPTRSNAIARLPGTGTYRLQLTVTDGERSHSDEVTFLTRRPAVQQTLVAAGGSWRYLDDGSDQGTAWRSRTFNDSSWKTGNAEFGYGEGDERTSLTINGTSGKTVTFYFRRSFNLPDPAAIQSLDVRLLRDDGAMVYLNGTLVFRSNMPEGDIDFQTWASEIVGGADEATFFEQAIDPALLVPGNNVLAVEVHQVNAGSSDVSFNLALDAMTSASNAAPIANAGPDLLANPNQPTTLQATFSDDGLPSPPGVVSFSWSQLQGPANASFDSPTSPNPRVTFPTAGRYILRFTVTDGALASSDDVAIDVGSAPDDYAAWRSKYFTTTELADSTVSGDHADPDLDGQGNRNEYLSGTHPRLASSVLQLTQVTRNESTIQLTFTAMPGYPYQVLVRTDLAADTWQTERTLDPGTCECPITVTLPAPSNPNETRFYRIRTTGKP